MVWPGVDECCLLRFAVVRCRAVACCLWSAAVCCVLTWSGPTCCGVVWSGVGWSGLGIIFQIIILDGMNLSKTYHKNSLNLTLATQEIL